MNENRKQEFLDLFYRDMFPHLAQCEKERIKQVIKAIITTIICIIVVGIWTYYCMAEDMHYTEVKYISIGLTLAGGLAFGYMFSIGFDQKFKNSIKNKYMNGILSYFGDIKWVPINGKTNIELTNKIGQNPVFDYGIYILRRIFEHFTGKHKNIEFNIYKIMMGHPKHGILLNFNIDVPEGLIVFNKNSWKEQNSTFIIIAMSFLSLFCVLFSIFCCIKWGFSKEFLISLPTAVGLGVFATWLYNVDKNGYSAIFNNEDAVSLGNKCYAIANNQDDISKFVKPELITILKNIKSCFKSKEIPLLRTHNDDDKTSLSILIPTKRSAFEICSLYKPMTKPQSMDQFFNQFKSLLDLINYFTDIEK